MSDVTIPADAAKAQATVLRGAARTLGDKPLAAELLAAADLFDPRPVSLRDECIEVAATRIGVERTVDAVLAVVRRRIEALPNHPDDRHVWQVIRRAAVLALFDEDGAR